MDKKQLLVMGVLTLACAVSFAAEPTWTPTKHNVVGTWQTNTNWFGDVVPLTVNFRSGIVGNEATINVNTSVQIYELAIGTPWDNGGYNSPTSKQGGTLNIGAGGFVRTRKTDPSYPGYTGPGNFYVAHLGNGTLNVTNGGNIRVDGEFSVSKTSGQGLAVFDGGWANVTSAVIGAEGTVILRNNAYFRVWSTTFNVAGVFEIADETSYLSFYGSVDPSVYQGKVTSLGGAGTLVATYDGTYTNVHAVLSETPNLRGDLSGDLKVDSNDLAILCSNWLFPAEGPNCEGLEGDIDGDCIVNLKDFVILADEWMIHVEKKFFVDQENGNDNNDGTTEATAFKTITRARNVIRGIRSNMAADIIVYLRGGTHTLLDGIVFESIDSGTNGRKIIYCAYGAETPVISGGENLTGSWTLHDSGLNIYKKTGVSGAFRQLYVNDQWGVRARKPNINADGTGDSYYSILNNSYPFEIDASHIGSWANNGVTEFVYIAHWTQNRGRISSYSVSGSRATVQFKSPENTFGSSVQNNGYFYLENAYTLLDAPGEWFHDRSTSTLYYIPRPGENMSTAQVIAPRAPMLVNFSGTLSAKVRNIRLEGITFKHNNWTETDNYGYFSGQGGHLIRTSNSSPTHRAVNGAINLRHSNNIKIERCTITQGGSWGIMQQDGCDNNTFESNLFSRLASGAIVLGNAIGDIGFYDLPAGSAAHTVIYNNTIDRVSFYYKDAPAIMALKTKQISVTCNTINNVPYTAISVGFEWNDSGAQDSHSNYLAYNKIYNAVYLLDDGAGIYALGRQQNSVMEYNYFSNIYGSQFNGGHPVVGVFLDNGSCYWNVRNNVIGNVSAVTYSGNPPVHDNVGRYNHYNTTNVGNIGGYSDWSSNYYETSWSGTALNIINNSGAR